MDEIIKLIRFIYSQQFGIYEMIHKVLLEVNLIENRLNQIENIYYVTI